ncbi:hypothetical protein [Tabrizicola sp. BL-A-41-H6]|uniref:hypothetical protein n=1 Tax=Tabrizicola sp. BL-A-41-H6 TaxID=3421107 RepID=UPI003D67BE47
MTALKQYQRLECTGLWREAPEDQRREVLVQFGDATLILSDPKSSVAISHWSLPAVERTNPGETPAVFSPGADATETLELDEPDMIAALEAVQGAVKAATARPGRLRGALLGTATVSVIALGAFWVPGALVAHTASVIPAAKRAEIGQTVLDDLTRVTGTPCDNQLGLGALAGIAERVFGPVDTPILYILPEGVGQPLSLPGDVIVLPRALAESSKGPEALAGTALVEGLRKKDADPMIALLDHVGLRATFQLLTTGDLPPGALQGYGEVLLQTTTTPPVDTRVLAAFEQAQIPATPYALSVDPDGKVTAGLVANDPYKGLSPTPLIPDDDWVALQAICTN